MIRRALSGGGNPRHTTLGARGVSFQRRVTIGFAAAAFVLVGVGIVAYRSITQFVSDARWESHTYQVLSAIQMLGAELNAAESDTRGYLITGEKQYLDSYRIAIDAVRSKRLSLGMLTEDNSLLQRRLAALDPLIAQKMAIMQEKQSRRLAGLDLAQELPLVTKGGLVLDEINHALHEMEAEEDRLLASRLEGTEIIANRSIRLIATSAALALILVSLAGWRINRGAAGRAATEAALRASETMFRGLLESAPDAMVIVDEKGAIEVFNAQAESMFGYTAEELCGQPIEILIPKRYAPEHVGKRNSYFASPVVRGMGVGIDLFGVRKDGVEIPVEISLSPMRTPTGLRVSSAIRDVTRQKLEAVELKTVNSALQARTSQLELANRELESFSYSVSHDLRAPLRSIDGFSQALLEDNAGKLDDESQDHIRRIRTATQRMGQLIDDLLGLAHMTRVEVRNERVNLSTVAREVIEELRSAAPARAVDVVIADGLIARADPNLLRIVLTNLLGNAWKFTGDRAQGQIEFGYCADDGKAGYFVRDNGVGFDMAYAAKLFGAFQRLHSSNDFPGTGIGLATVQRIVHRHGGRVWAEADAGKGATFHFSLSAAA